MKKTARLLSALLVVTLLSFGLQQSAQAVNTTLSYTNTTADAWLTPTSWIPANNWYSGATVKTNTTTADVRLNIGTVSNQAVSVTYDATMGTTIFDNTGVATIGLVIGGGNGTTGAVTIAGGTLVIRNGAQTQVPSVGGLLVGNASAGGAVQATLTLSGGNLIFTNATGSGYSVMSVLYRGGSTNGGPITNFAHGTFTINSGSTATIERIFFGFNTADTAAQSTGTINLNAGGTLSTRNISGRDGDASQMTSLLNFNGGTLRVLGANIASPTTPFITDAGTGSNLTVNVQSGGAVIDTAGFNATIAKGLLNGGGGGGLTKNGLATLTLSQTNTYTGATVVNGGGLSFVLPMSSSALTLAGGTTNTITVNDNSWTNSVTSVTNAIINLTLGAVTAVPSATTAVINTATLNVSGTNVINITSGTGLPTGTVKLIDYTSSANRFGGGSFVLGKLPAGLQATLVDGPNDVSLNVTLSVPSLIWTASVNNEWAINGLLNWNSGLSAYQEYPSGVGDVVNFTDAAGSFYTVNLTSNVKPADVVLNHTSSSAVTLTGVGQITGINGITKTGTGTTLLSLSNSFAGVVSVNNGILQVNDGGALGSPAGVTAVTGTGTVMIGDGFGAGTTVTGETITLDGGTGFGGSLGQLRGSIDPDSPNVWAGPIVLAANQGRIGTAIGGNLTVAGPIIDNGSNYMVLYRPGDGGTITASYSAHSCGGTATFMGNLAVVKLGVNNGFSTNVLQVGPGNTDLNGFNQTIGGLEQYYSPGLLINNGAGASTLTINTVGTNGFVATAAIQDGSQPISLVKEGSGRQSLNSTNNTYTGNTVVNNGELRLSNILGNTAVSVNAGASLTVFSGATVAGTITVNSGGTLSPGLPGIIGVLTNTSTVTLNAGSTNLFRVDVGNTNLNDRLVANNVSYGGTLVVTNQGTTPLTNGQVFQLVLATTPNNNFASVVIQNGGTGHFTPGTGQLTIDTVPATASSNAYLTGIMLSPVVAFTPAFDSNSLSGYTATENYGDSFTVTVTNADATATNVLIYNGSYLGLVTNGVPYGPLGLNVNPGVTNLLSVQVTAQDGTTARTYAVNVAQIPSQTSPKLTNGMSGTNLVLGWDLAHLGYRLLEQTNNLNKGVSMSANDWGELPNSQVTNTATIPIVKTNLNKYYRLVYP
jgi:autotransporter-associated beta strand protein